jgi:hypothetical protein
MNFEIVMLLFGLVVYLVRLRAKPVSDGGRLDTDGAAQDESIHTDRNPSAERWPSSASALYAEMYRASDSGSHVVALRGCSRAV